MIESITPLVAPALLTWGALAVQMVPVAHVSFVYACLMALSFYTHAAPVQVRWRAHERKGGRRDERGQCHDEPSHHLPDCAAL